MIAGPSEVLVVADSKNNPDHIAIDLLAQAEHDELAQSILITDDKNFSDKVIKSIDNFLENLERRKSLGQVGTILGQLLFVMI